MKRTHAGDISKCKKRAYNSKTKVNSIRSLQQGFTGVKLYVYKCKTCKAYHLTHVKQYKNTRT